MRNTVVVDTSIVIKWVLDEPDSYIASALLSKWFSEGITMLAPVLLIYELTNVLHQRVRKSDITLDRSKQLLANVFLKALEFDDSQDRNLSARAMEFAHRFGLPAAYDAHYLALAERENCEYWTADSRLYNAVRDKLPLVHQLGE